MPERPYCDLVMKGGITSGVIYPSAAVRLAEIYTFRNIGGTSAGAIAAAATAAAEYARQNGSPAGFRKLAEFPGWIGAPGRLFGMFAPDRSTEPLFALVTASLRAKTRLGKLLVIAAAITRYFRPAVLAGVVAVLILAWLQSSVLAAVLSGSIVFTAALIAHVWTLFAKKLPRNFYGLSKAFDPKEKRPDGPLTNWLTSYLDELAGKSLDGPPLTFGDLASCGVNLEMMTTAVNHGRPYRLPFGDPYRVFYFCPEEFRTLFPERVVRHMIEHAPHRDDSGIEPPAGKTLVPFCDPEQLPVIVATRMSLSFPMLLSAVPLYAVDFTRKERPFQPERCWFSDGGLSSNLPIHFFDAPIPQWPTFAINLKQFHPDYPDEKDAVWLPMKNNSGWRSEWTRFEPAGGFGSPLKFLSAILDAMQNWQDNTLARVPGYRDRIVSVSHREDEGGLNLNMDCAAVDRLSDRGRRAADLLIERFYEDDGWRNHAWLRFRSCAQLTAHWLEDLAPAEDPWLLNMIDRDPPSYPVEAAERAAFHDGIDAMFEASHKISGAVTAALDEHAPRPEPELRIRPRI